MWNEILFHVTSFLRRSSWEICEVFNFKFRTLTWPSADYIRTNDSTDGFYTFENKWETGNKICSCKTSFSRKYGSNVFSQELVGMREYIIFKFIFLENKETYGKIVFYIFHLSWNVLLHISISVHHSLSFSTKLAKLKRTCRINKYLPMSILSKTNLQVRKIFMELHYDCHPILYILISVYLDTFYILLYNDQLIYKIITKCYIIIFILHVIRVLWVFVPPNLS